MVLSDEDELLPKRIFRGGLLGIESSAPAITDVTQSVDAHTDRDDESIDLLVVYPTAGPASADLIEVGKPKGQLYHYYVDTSGAVLRLVDEALAARAAGRARWEGKGKIDKRSIAVGVEQGLASMSDEQAAALSWLLRDIQSRHGLASAQIIQAADLGIGEHMPSWDRLA
jgi:N-acetylmuramoyl-L-alanine amidase